MSWRVAKRSAMSEPHFKAVQHGFTAWLRDPPHHGLPTGVAPERMALYRELIYRNVDDGLGRAFPVLRTVLDAGIWQEMVTEFVAHHRASTPLYRRIAEEFLYYLADHRGPAAWPPFALELARYEWAEAEVLFDPHEIAQCETAAGLALLDGCVLPNPTLRAAAYRFPVHRICATYQPQQVAATPSFLVVWRRRDDSAGCMELNAVAARLLELIVLQDGRHGRALLEAIAFELKHPTPTAVIEGGREILQTFLAKDIVLGARAAARLS